MCLAAALGQYAGPVVPARAVASGLVAQEPLPLPEQAVRVLLGPERIESGWWDGADVRRDYYRVELRGGRQAWAYRPVGEQGPLLLQGWFA